MNRTKLIVAAIAIGLAGLSLTIFLTFKLMDGTLVSEPLPPAETRQELSPGGDVEPVPGTETHVESPIGVIGDPQGQELLLGEAMAIEQEARELIQAFRFEDAEMLIVNRLEKFSIEESTAYKEVLQPLRYDLPGLSQFDYLWEYQDEEPILAIAREMQDPRNLLVGILWMEPQLREKIIVSAQSLNPGFEKIDSVGVPKVVEAELDEFRDAEIFEILFSVDQNPLRALIAKEEGKLYLHSILPVEGATTPYITIEAWRQIRSDFEKTTP